MGSSFIPCRRLLYLFGLSAFDVAQVLYERALWREKAIRRARGESLRPGPHNKDQDKTPIHGDEDWPRSAGMEAHLTWMMLKMMTASDICEVSEVKTWEDAELEVTSSKSRCTILKKGSFGIKADRCPQYQDLNTCYPGGSLETGRFSSVKKEHARVIKKGDTRAFQDIGHQYRQGGTRQDHYEEIYQSHREGLVTSKSSRRDTVESVKEGHSRIVAKERTGVIQEGLIFRSRQKTLQSHLGGHHPAQALADSAGGVDSC